MKMFTCHTWQTKEHQAGKMHTHC